MNPGEALIVKSCGTNISANVTDGALSHKLDLLTYFVASKYQRVSQLHCCFKSYSNFNELM